MLLSSTVKKENDLFTVDLTNPDLKSRTGQICIPRGSLHVFRTKFLWHGTCYERLRVSNFEMAPVETELTLAFAADYADIFEVRGTKRPQCGRRDAPIVDGPAVMLAYEGLDKVTRATRIAFEPAPDELAGHQATFRLKLPPRERDHDPHRLRLRDGGLCRSPGGRLRARVRRAAGRDRARAFFAVPRARAELRPRRVDRALGLRPGDDDHRDAARAVPVRGRAVVQHAVRARRHHHGARDVVAGARRRARRAVVPGGDAGDRGDPRARRAAGQDPARGARRRDGRRWARSRSAATTAASTRRRCS